MYIEQGPLGFHVLGETPNVSPEIPECPVRLNWTTSTTEDKKTERKPVIC